jgi:hypothetical protein
MASTPLGAGRSKNSAADQRLENRSTLFAVLTERCGANLIRKERLFLDSNHILGVGLFDSDA